MHPILQNFITVQLRVVGCNAMTSGLAKTPLLEELSPSVDRLSQCLLVSWRLVSDNSQTVSDTSHKLNWGQETATQCRANNADCCNYCAIALQDKDNPFP